MANRGLLVAVDGPSGVGTSTTVKCLMNALLSEGYSAHATKEPSSPILGEITRHQTDQFRGHALACLVAADRYHRLSTEIRPRRDAGKIVVSDRYIASSYVLQRMEGVPVDFIEALNAQVDPPDLAVLLTGDPAVIAWRMSRRSAHNRFQKGVQECTRQEVDFYREAAERLTRSGVPVAEFDTTGIAPRHIAEDIVWWITHLTERPGRTA